MHVHKPSFLMPDHIFILCVAMCMRVTIAEVQTVFICHVAICKFIPASDI